MKKTALTYGRAVILLYAVHILSQYRFTAHDIHKADFHCRQHTVSRYKVKALVVVHDFCVFSNFFSQHNFIHDITKSMW